MSSTITEVRAMSAADPVFADLVLQLWRARKARQYMKDRRAQLYELIVDEHRRAMDNGSDVLTLGHPGGDDARAVKRREVAPEPKWTVPSAVAKKAAPQVWARAKRTASRVATTPPKTLAVPTVAQLDMRLPAVPAEGERWELRRIVDNYEDASDVPYASDEDAAKARLVEYSTDRLGFVPPELRGDPGIEPPMWDGTPIVFGDGWKVGLTVTQYDADVLREIAPELWEKLAVQVTPASYETVYVSRSLPVDGEYAD
ncbi:hypothetical protein SEA_BIGGITYBASS_59 [Gordonia phage BiggityBass]|nr:hypothetical protein SEA_BIGGITYBASS_59 [Gordonia phage BiggityBass]